MSTHRRKDLLLLNDKLFVMAIFSQLVIMILIFSCSFGVYVWNKKRDADQKVQSNFEDWEPRLTEAVYLNSITSSWEMSKIPVVQNFKSSLLINGYPSDVFVENCDLASLQSAKKFPLKLGELKLKQCLFIQRKPDELFAAAYWAAALALISVLLTGLIWLLARSLFKRRLLEPLILSMEKEAKDAAIGKMASQIAHDVRSPLAALKILMRDTYGLQEEKRVLLQSAVGRIQDIANNVLPNRKSKLKKRSSVTRELISNLLETLISEKRVQYRDLLQLEIDIELSKHSYAAFADIEVSDFSRAISNIIDNAVEALESKAGYVRVRLECPSSSKIRIEVEDNGKGIPARLLPDITKERVSVDKVGGSGLGLHFVRKSIEKLGGRLKFKSEIGAGTTVQLELKRAETPAWFAQFIPIREGISVAVVDDDAAIHKVWSSRFNSIRAKERGIELLHFISPAEIDKELSKRKTHFDLYLVDYEFVGSETNGLDWIVENKLEKTALLVTSRFEENQLRQKCQVRSVQLVPKLLSAYVPFEIIEKMPMVATNPPLQD